MKTKLPLAASWATFLASLLSEYVFDFDFDFPLTPACWLVIALCATVLAAVLVGNGYRPNHCRATAPVAVLINPMTAGGAPALQSNRINRCAEVCHQSCKAAAPVAVVSDKILTNEPHPTIFALLATSAAIPVIMFLLPATSRGPPFFTGQKPRLPSRPAAHTYFTPLFSNQPVGRAPRLPNSSLETASL
jgi:hypothetical protein